ncbi:cytochrome P450 [Dendrothele bispora CBS 962.96]|uniref:Cytochrome P450 n=1 Tax=Dendrothele bispora (strain CBS 962.96) TaxID=1314807 RepID=A0A4S8LVM8_DENBC|nr:cytochrome P450 [Dendrothele bispora CBS 962.96]
MEFLSLVSNPFALSTLAVIALLTVKLSRAYHAGSKFKHIPTLGPDGLWSSYITVFRWLTNSVEMVEEGYRLYPKKIFRIPTLDGWQIILNSTKFVDDLRRASDEQLSFVDATAVILRDYYTIHPKLMSNPYHVDVIRHSLTRNIDAGFGDIQEELESAVPEKIPLSEGTDWTEIHAWPAVLEIVVRTANRFLVGLPLCRDPDFRQLNIDFAMSVFKNAMIINLFPEFLHPIVGRVFSGRRVAMRKLKKHLQPIIEERLKMKEIYGKEWQDKPNDFIQWLIDAEEFAPLSQRSSVEDICARVLVVNFGAIDSTSTILAALYRLASNPDATEIMRNELESITRREGTTKAAVTQMQLLDSFLKESVRLSPSTAVGVFRRALKDFTFSDGTIVPSGTIITFATWAIMRDEEIYPGGSEFRPFRFAEMRGQEGEGTKHHFSTVSPEWLLFGQGRHTCPGRFFASTEIKAFLAYILMNYDVKFRDDSKNVPERSATQVHTGPDVEARVMFRKRRPKVD